MKKIFILSTLLVASLMQAVADDSNIAEVLTADEFIAAVEANKDIVLMDNIDMTGKGTINTIFSGSIEGSGSRFGKETIYAIYKDDRDEETATHTPLVLGMKGATVSNVAFVGFRVESDDYGNQGVLGAFIEGCTIEHVRLMGISVFSNEDNAGALAGTSLGSTITDVLVMDCDVRVDGVCAGAIVGSSSMSHFTQCLTNIYTVVFADGTPVNPGAAYAGGICGKSSFDDFVECANLGIVCANDDQVGGIVAHSEGSNFYACTNGGYVFQAEEEDLNESYKDIQKAMADQLDSADAMQMAGGLISFFGFSFVGAAIMAYVTPFVSCPPLAAVFVVAVAIAGVTILIEGSLQKCDVVGGICGKALDGEFICCSNYGACAVVDSYVGGIVGYADCLNEGSKGVTIKNCLNAGQLNGDESLGGIVGGLFHSRISNCLNVGELNQGDLGKPWGPAFAEEENSTVSNIYYKNVKTTNGKGEEIDEKFNIKGDESNCMAVVSVTDDELSSGEVCWWLNENNEDGPWHQNLEGENPDPYPMLDADHSTVTPETMSGRIAISTADELMSFAETVNSRSEADKDKNYIAYLTADIDLTGKAWTPIGTESMPFRGIFLGCGHTISNLQCNVTNGNDAGLFGTIGVNTEIYDVTIDQNSSITSTENAVGGIVGCVRVPASTPGKVKIIGCGNNATVQGSYNVGGILGAVYLDEDLQLEIRDCYNAGTIYATSRGEGKTGTGESGAICGNVKANSTIADCWNIGNVLVAKGTSAITSAYVSGRFFVDYGGSSAPSISHCYNMLDDEYAQTGVEHFTLTDLNDGTLCYNLNNETNDTSKGLRWEMELGSNPINIRYTGYNSQSRGIYHARTISNPIGTIVLPYDVESNDDVTFYELLGTVTPGVLSFQSVDVLCAGVPGLFQMHTDEEGPFTYDFLSKENEFNLSEKDLTIYENGDCTMYGTYSGVTITDAATLAKTYYISGGEVRQATKSLTVSPFRAYIQCETGVGANGLRVSLDGHTTDIVLLPAAPSAASDAETPVFDLFGRRAVNPQQGIYIQNGKKIMMK